MECLGWLILIFELYIKYLKCLILHQKLQPNTINIPFCHFFSMFSALKISNLILHGDKLSHIFDSTFV